MSHLTLPANEPNSTSALPEEPSVLVAKKHHLLLRWSHWLNVPILLGLILSGISIYWASPDRSVGRACDVLVLPRISVRKTNTPQMAASPFQHEIQRAPARSILFYSGRRVSFGYNRLGDS